MKNRLDLTFSIAILLFLTVHTLVAQRSIGNPEFVNDFGAFTEVCSEPDDIFMVRATLFPGDPLPNGNEYILELSDENGDFTNPVEIARVNGPNNGSSSELDIEFDNVLIPEGTAGDNYRIRITTSETDITSTISDALAIYYYRNDLALRINGARDIILCNLTSFTRDLTVDITDIDDDSVVDANQFEFEWFRGAFPGGSLITGATGPTFTVTESELDANGRSVFYARIKLGACNSQFSNARSNNIRVSLLEVDNIFIVGGPTFNFCPGDMGTLQSSETDPFNDYQWFKDGEPIEGAILPTYNIPNDNFEGEYRIDVTFSIECTVPSDPVTLINDGSSITTPLIDNLIILPTEMITLEVTTDAPATPAASNFQWFRNGSPLTGILSLDNQTISIDAVDPGEYRIDILADDGCPSFLTSSSNIFTPIGIGLTIVTSEDNDCNNPTVSIELEEMFGFTLPSSGGPPQIALTEEQYDFFDFQWFRDDVPVAGATNTTLEISTSDEGAIYVLRATLKTGEFTDISSNELSINPIPADIAITVGSGELPITLSVIQDSDYTYEWFRFVDGEDQLIEGETANTLVVNEEGEYFVRVSSGICERDTPRITIGPPAGISAVIPNVITPNGSSGMNDSWVLPDEFEASDVQVTIYSSNGKLDFEKSGGYNEDWPSNSASGASELVYYYIITRNSSVVRKGTITVMR